MQLEAADEMGEAFASPSLIPIVRSKRWDACLAVYGQMAEESRLSRDDNGATLIQVWTGYIGAILEKFGYSRSQGSQIMKDLERMGCIEVKELGKRTRPTSLVVLQPPTQEAFAASRDTLYTESRQVASFNADQTAKLELIERVRQVEETLEVVLDQMNKHIAEDHAQE